MNLTKYRRRRIRGDRERVNRNNKEGIEKRERETRTEIKNKEKEDKEKEKRERREERKKLPKGDKEEKTKGCKYYTPLGVERLSEAIYCSPRRPLGQSKPATHVTNTVPGWAPSPG
jgi:hypothetical protein